MNNSERDFVPQPDPSVSETVQQVSALLEQTLPDTQPGQLWRASWNEDLVLCLVVQVGDDHRVEVAPLALDEEIGDPYSITFDSHLSPLQTPLTALAGICTSIKEYVLDAYFGEIERGLLDLVRILRADNLAGRPPSPLGQWEAIAKLGDPDAGDIDERRDFRLEISHQLSRIAAADFLPEVPTQSATLHEVLRESGVQLADLRKKLNISLSDARAITRGAVPLKPEQTELLASLPGLSQEKLARAMPMLPEGYISAVQHPIVSRQVRREAHRKGVHPRAIVQSIPGRIAARRQQNYDSSGRQLSSEEKYWKDAVITLLSSEGGLE